MFLHHILSGIPELNKKWSENNNNTFIIIIIMIIEKGKRSRETKYGWKDQI